MQRLCIEVVRNDQHLTAHLSGGQGQQQQVWLESPADGQPRVLIEALPTQAIGQTFDIPQDVDPAPDEPLSVPLVPQGRLQGIDLRPVAQMLQGLGQLTCHSLVSAIGGRLSSCTLMG
jgi:hypothetical protein